MQKSAERYHFAGSAEGNYTGIYYFCGCRALSCDDSRSLRKQEKLKIVMPRQIAMYLCRDIIDTSLKTIGKNLGNRDHTTVMHGIEKIEKELQTNDNLKNSIDTLRKKINPQG